MDNEIWKDIVGYEGMYSVSNKGRVRSLCRKIWNGYDFVVHQEQILKPNILHKGYLQVTLNDSRKRKCMLVHRLVAIAFLPNPNNYDQINHIDGNKQNNNVENLEWCNNSMNQKHAYANGLNKHSKYSGRPKRKVLLINKNTDKIIFNSISEAAKYIGDKKSIKTSLHRVLHHHPHYLSIYGYKAEFYE